jgi:hypothetical protein
VVKSKFDAPAKESKVNDFVKKLQGLEGELRSSSEDVLKDYGIDDDSAIHLVLLGAEGQKNKHLLLGKPGSNWGEVFVRLAGSSDVYLASENLRRDLGVYSAETTGSIESTPWCELDIMKVAKEDLSRIELAAPHRRLILELREKAEPAADAAPSADADPEEAPATPEEEWVLLEPKLDLPPKESGIKQLTGAFSNVTVSDVIGRNGLESYGLEEPVAGCTITTKSGEVRHLWFGNPLPDGGGAHYVRLNDEDLVYKMDVWKLDSIFLKMSNLMDIDAPKFSKADVTGLTAERVDRRFEFDKKENSWQTGHPALDRKLKDDRIDKILDIVTNLKPLDLATVPTADITRLGEPAAVLRFSLTGGEQHTLTFGGEVPLTAGDRFVQLDDRKEIWTISKANWDAVEPAAPKLFDLDLADFEIADVTSLTLRDADGEVKLALIETEPAADAESETARKQWIVEGEDKPVNQEKVRSVLLTLAALSGADLYEKAEDTGLDKPAWSADVFLLDGNAFYLAIGNRKALAGYYARVSGEDAIYILPADTVTRLTVLTRQLCE